jgi:ATP-dependent Clp protease adaptor protein ClpS
MLFYGQARPESIPLDGKYRWPIILYRKSKREMDEHSRTFDLDTWEDEDEETREPDMFRVVLHNDHYTTMDFVVEVIIKVFHKPVVQAAQIMMDVHRKGRGLVGVYTRDVAETKCAQVLRMARAREFPLKCTVEREG